MQEKTKKMDARLRSNAGSVMVSQFPTSCRHVVRVVLRDAYDVPMPTISDWLGHSNIETTRIYARVTERMKQEALTKLSEGGTSVFRGDAVFNADNGEVLRTLCGLK